MRTREQIEKQVKKERQIDNDVYDLRPDVTIELLLDIRRLLSVKERTTRDVSQSSKTRGQE